MLVWFLMLGGIVLARFLTPDNMVEKKKKLIFLGLTFGIIVFVVGSRSALITESSDLFAYYRLYGRSLSWSLNELSEAYNMEYGYLLLNKILAWLVPWNYFIVYFEAAFCTFVMLWYIYRNADDAFLAVMIFVCIGPWQFFLTGFRQSLALCICVIALELIKKRKVATDLIALGLVCLAASLHSTAFVFLIVFLLRYLKINKIVIALSVVITIILLFTIEGIISWGNEIRGTEYEGVYVGNVLGGLIPILVYVLTLILCYAVYKGNKDFVVEHNLEILILLLGLCIYILRYKSLVLERVSFYFTPVICVLLCNAITRKKNKYARNAFLILCVVCCIVLFIYRVHTQYGEYHFFWEHIENGELYEWY